jgi:HNH endonuclease
MKIPGNATITNRSSTISSQFARARAPYIKPTAAQIEARYKLFNIDPEQEQCAYCGGIQTEWDHIFAVVEETQWTGYATEIGNLIPACGKCNQSRGKKSIRGWMSSSAPWAPLKVFMARDGMSEDRARAEVERRVAIIENAISQHGPQKIIYDPTDPDEIELEQYRRQLLEILPKAQAIAARLQKRYLNQA